MPLHADLSSQPCASLRPLADEISRSLAQVARLLDTQGLLQTEPADAAATAEAARCLYEVQGALAIAGEPGLAALAQSLRAQVLAGGDAGKLQAEDLAHVTRDCQRTMQRALDGVLRGIRPPAAALLACWQRVAALGGAPGLHPSALVSLQLRECALPWLPPDPRAATAPDESEQALLDFLRAQQDGQRSAAARRIADVLAHVGAQTEDADERARWLALRAFLIEFAQAGGDPVRAKKIVASTARALRHIGDDGTVLAAAARDALFELAQQDCVTDDAREVARLFHLDTQFAAKDGDACGDACGDEACDAFSAAIADEIAAIDAEPGRLHDPARWHALADLAASAAAWAPVAVTLREIASRLAESAPDSQDGLAAALLCVQACACARDSRAEELQALVGALSERDTSIAIRRMQSWSRASGAHRLMLDLSATLHAEMAVAEQALDASADMPAACAAAVALMANIAGALQMLALDETRDAVLALWSRMQPVEAFATGIDDETARQWVQVRESFLLLPWCRPASAEEPVGQRMAAVAEPVVEEVIDDGCDGLDAIFVDEAAGLLRALRAQSASLDTAALVHAAHTLAGCSATVGAAGIAELALALEEAAAREAVLEPASLAATLQAFDEMLAQFVATGRCSVHPPLVAQWRLGAEPAAIAADEPREPHVDAAEETDKAPMPAPMPVLALVPSLAPAVHAALEVEADVVPGVKDAAACDIVCLPADPPPADAAAPDGEAELLAIFNEEAADLLPQIEQAVRAWQQRPDDREQPAQLLRVLHTLKGSARMAGQHELGADFHHAEAEVAALAQQAPSATAARLPALLERVDRWLNATSVAPPSSESGTPARADEPAAAPPSPQPDAPSPMLRVRADRLAQFADSVAEVWVGNARLREGLQEQRRSVADLSDDLARLRSQLRELEIEAESRILSRATQGAPADFDPLEFDRYTRLHELTRMMAESITDIAGLQRALARQVEGLGSAASAQARDLRRQQAELQALRSQTLQSAEARLRHLLRQASREAGREAELQVDGAQVEIERGLLDRLMGPLEHLLRNAAVHGIEPPDERERLGKPRVGKVTLAASLAGNELRLTLADDGRGLDAGRIRERALAVGLLRADEAPDPRALAALIFEPGFSTASEVTALSGRGIGMDAVRVELQALGGRIDVDSEPGHGCRFAIRLPTSMASVQVILATAGRWRIALPAGLLQQVLQLDPAQIRQGDGGSQIDWQGAAIRLLHLGNALGDAGVNADSARVPVAVLRDGGHVLALQLDAIAGQREVIVRHPGAQLAQVPGLAGATVLGDGGIALVIDPFRLPAIAPASLPPVEERRAPLVLVVDDSLTVRRASQRLLERHGYRVALARDGIEALEQLQQQPVAAVLLDIEMPRMDGFELLAALRDDARLRSLPVVMITSRIAERHRERATLLGASAYMGKPYDEEALLALLSEACAVPAAA